MIWHQAKVNVAMGKMLHYGHCLIRPRGDTQVCTSVIRKMLTTAYGAPVHHTENAITAGPRGPVLSKDVRHTGASESECEVSGMEFLKRDNDGKVTV